jgi:antitoxin component YwqK of YwqJK toxin-antitoxin module
MKNILLLISICLLFANCKQKRQLEQLTDYNNKLVYEYEYIVKNGDTILDGYYKEYRDNGKIKYDLNYQNGQLHGQAKYYWDNEQCRTILNYENGKILSQQYNWDKEGKIIDSITITNGNGILKEYYPTRRILSTSEIKNGIENGESIEYDKNGNLEFSFTYKDGIKNGMAIKKDRGFTIKYSYKEDKEDGGIFIYDSLNNLVSIDKVSNGILVDTSYVFFQDKKLHKMTIYKSNDFNSIDSLTLGLKEEKGIFGELQKFMLSKGIKLKEIEFDIDGNKISDIEFEDGVEKTKN